VEGMSVKKIVTDLHVSINTINSQGQEAMKRLNVDNLADLVKLAIREGLTPM